MLISILIAILVLYFNFKVCLFRVLYPAWWWLHMYSRNMYLCIECNSTYFLYTWQRVYVLRHWEGWQEIATPEFIYIRCSPVPGATWLHSARLLSGTSCMSHFWRLEFCFGTVIFGKIVHPRPRGNEEQHKTCQNSAAVEIQLRRFPNISHRCHSLNQVARLEEGKYE